MSEDDLEAGVRWNHEMVGALEESHFGILCLTSENVNAPWLYFEAGALAKSLQLGRVVPYLIEMSPAEIPAGPLAQFQAKRATEADTLQLLQAINAQLGEEALASDRLDRAFRRAWPELRTALAAAGGPDAAPRRPDQRAMMEEILETVRGLSRQLSGDAGQALELMQQRLKRASYAAEQEQGISEGSKAFGHLAYPNQAIMPLLQERTDLIKVLADRGATLNKVAVDGRGRYSLHVIGSDGRPMVAGVGGLPHDPEVLADALASAMIRLLTT